MTNIRAHVVGCRKTLSVPVDLCQCGGRDVVFDADLAAEIASLRASLKIAQDKATTATDAAARYAEEVIRLCAELDKSEAQLKTAEQEMNNPEKWMRWCDHRVLERAEKAESKLSTLLAAQERLIAEWTTEADDPECPLDDSNRATRKMCAEALSMLGSDPA